MMLVPFLLNYFICWYVWATTDKRKTVSWIAILLSFYPQYIALKTSTRSGSVLKSSERPPEEKAA